jgi:DNA-binding winged helix-turn-helix (wHTH) protein
MYTGRPLGSRLEFVGRLNAEQALEGFDQQLAEAGGFEWEPPEVVMQEATSTVYEFGPFRLDVAKRLLLCEGKSQTLAPKTFDLLFLLVQGRDRVLTKKELLQALWPGTFVEEGNLAFQVSALRKVLGAHGEEWIETLPRYGYRFKGAVSQLAVEPTGATKSAKTVENGHAEAAKGEVEMVDEGPFHAAQPKKATRTRTPTSRTLVAAAAIVQALVIAWLAFRGTPSEQRTFRFLISPPPKVTIPDLDSIALSPDGSRLAFIGEASDGQRQLWLRPLDSITAEPVAGTELATAAFWSPDSQSIAFFAAGKLKRMDLHGGSPQVICETPAGRGTWSQNGVILIDGVGPEIYRVSAAGGEPKPATALDGKNYETLHALPQFLPDGNHFIYLAQSARSENTGIYVASLDSKRSKRLVSSNTNALCASPFRGGPAYLLFTAGTDLVRQALDLRKLVLVSDPVHGEFLKSRGDRRLIQSATVLLPPVRNKV